MGGWPVSLLSCRGVNNSVEINLKIFSLVVRKSLSVIYFQISDKSLSDNYSLVPETLMDQKKI